MKNVQSKDLSIFFCNTSVTLGNKECSAGLHGQAILLGETRCPPQRLRSISESWMVYRFECILCGQFFMIRPAAADRLDALYVWIAVIAIIKLSSITAGYIRQKKLVSVHSVLNKAAGLLLFVFPLTLAFMDLRYSGAVVCMAATAAAIQEGSTVWARSGRQNTSRETV